MFEHHGHGSGKSLTANGVYASMPDGWNDRVSEVYAKKGDWILYQYGLGSGMSWCVREGQRIRVPSNFNDQLSSFKPSMLR